MIHLIASMTLLGLTHLACYAAMIERKYSLLKTVLIYSLFCIAFVCLTAANFILLGQNSEFSIAAGFLITITMGFFVFMFTSADPVCKKIFLFVSYSNLFCIFQCIATILCGICFPDLSEIGTTYARSIIRTLLYIPTVWAYVRFLRPTVREIPVSKKKTWYSITLVSVLFTFVFLIFLTFCNSGYNLVGQYLPLFAIVVIIFCSVLWVVFGTIRYMLNENKMELVSQNMEYLQGQLKVARENELFARTIRHDFHHHNQNIAAMLQKGETHEALRYIEQYNESLDAAKSKEFCPHVTVNAILNSFYTKASNDGISVSVSADTQEESAVADMHFVAILSNILENAVNGCKECASGGEITVNIRTLRDKTVIVCSNPCRQDLAIENNMIKEKGIGIDSMLTATRKYNGDIRYQLEDGILTVCIILKT